VFKRQRKRLSSKRTPDSDRDEFLNMYNRSKRRVTGKMRLVGLFKQYTNRI